MAKSRGKNSDERVYCICRGIDDGSQMVGCDTCEEWFHLSCLGLKSKIVNAIDNFNCSTCLDADPNLYIVYKDGHTSRTKYPVTRNNIDENLDKLVIDTKQRKSRGNRRSVPTAETPTPPPPAAEPEKAASPVRPPRPQCHQPDCRQPARAASKYCSDECGIKLANMRLEKFFVPTANEYMNGSNKLQEWRVEEAQKLINERGELIEKAKNLEMSIDSLTENIRKIREEAQIKLDSQEEEDEDDSAPLNNDNEAENEVEAGTRDSEASRIACVSCGGLHSASVLLKHWASCFKRNETMYTYSNNFQHVDIAFKDYFTQPLFCDREVRTKDRPVQYCKRLLYICPEHNNAPDFAKFEDDDVCACPLTISRELVLDGNYCIETKKNCTQHYQWERFRRAHIDIERLQIYQRLNEVTAKIAMISENISKQGGGVLGLMLHKAIPAKSNLVEEESEDVDMSDV